MLNYYTQNSRLFKTIKSILFKAQTSIWYHIDQNPRWPTNYFWKITTFLGLSLLHRPRTVTLIMMRSWKVLSLRTLWLCNLQLSHIKAYWFWVTYWNTYPCGNTKLPVATLNLESSGEARVRGLTNAETKSNPMGWFEHKNSSLKACHSG